MVKSWQIAPDPGEESTLNDQRILFSRDGSRLLTHYSMFAVWSVPDGRLIASAAAADIDAGFFRNADFGVPGSASDGLIGLGAAKDNSAAELWDISESPTLPPPQAGRGGLPPIRPRLRSRVALQPAVPGEGFFAPASLQFSPDGSKFAVAWRGVASVYDVASLARLGSYTSRWEQETVVWVPGGEHVQYSSRTRSTASVCLWDFSRPEAPPVVTVDVGRDEEFQGWLLGGASYLISRELAVCRVPDGPKTFAVEERRVADGSVVRSVIIQSRAGTHGFIDVCLSPDLRALLVFPCPGFPPRILVFG